MMAAYLAWNGMAGVERKKRGGFLNFSDHEEKREHHFSGEQHDLMKIDFQGFIFFAYCRLHMRNTIVV